MKIIGFLISLILLSGLCTGGYAGYQALQTHIEDSKITSITPNTDGFTIQGILTLLNPGWLTLPLQKGEYTVILESGEELGKGTIDGKPIPPGLSELPFQQEVKWTPSGALLLQLAIKEHVYATIKGTLTLDIFGVYQIHLPFEQRIDLAQYIQALKKNIVQNVVKTVFG